MFRDRDNIVRKSGKKLFIGSNQFRNVAKSLLSDLFSIEEDGKTKENQSQSEQKKESYYRDKLAKQLNGKTEVNTPVGRIDILTSNEIIEVKHFNKWKEAIGQIIAYSEYYPRHQKRIHLFAVDNKSKLSLIKQHCHKNNIILTWE